MRRLASHRPRRPQSAVSRRAGRRLQCAPRAANVAGNHGRANADAIGAMSSRVASPPIVSVIVREIMLTHGTFSLAGVRPAPACSGRSRWRGVDAARGLPSRAPASSCSLGWVASFLPKYGRKLVLASPPHDMASGGRNEARRPLQQVWGRTRGRTGMNLRYVRQTERQAQARRRGGRVLAEGTTEARRLPCGKWTGLRVECRRVGSGWWSGRPRRSARPVS
jgi:hypothetical protein